MNDLEGGSKTVMDVNKAPVQFGINKAYNKDANVGNLTESQARDYYKANYKIDKYAPKGSSPAFKAVVQDTIIQHSPQATKRMVDAANGDPYKLLDLRRQYYAELARRNPKKYASIYKGVMNRYNKLENYISNMESA